MIVDEDLERVRTESDIVAVVSGYTQLKRSGRRFVGLCPFHSERSGSFSVNAEQNLYYCFGCQAKGDVITFVREKEGLDFVGAVEWLAQRAGIQLRYTDAGEGQERKRKAHLQEIVGRAASWYHERLLTGSDAADARKYLRARGFTGDLVRQFGLGWAPDEWDALARHLQLSDRDFSDSGLGLVNRRNRQQDWFRGRILFPITDVQGNPVGFGGRILPGREGAKYINSRDSLVYSKSSVLYGLDRAKSAIVAADEVVICEGYTDVIGYHIAGIPRSVATCGTALTEQHVKMLKKFANRVVLSFDSDAAGQSAAARFYAWERTYDLDVRVVDLPEGADPGDVARSDPEQLGRAVAGARPFLEFRVRRVLSTTDISTVEGRARAAEAALAVVAEHPDPLVRDAYSLQIADHTQMPVESIRALSSGSASPRAAYQEAVPVDGGGDGPRFRGRFVSPTTSRPLHGPEVAALRLAAHDPAEVARLLSSDVFVDEHLGDLFALLVGGKDLNTAIESADPEGADLLYRLAVETPEAEPLDVAARMWTRFLERERDHRLRTLEFGDDQHQQLLQQELRWFQQTLEALQEPGSQEATVAQLLAWLTSPAREVD